GLSADLLPDAFAAVRSVLNCTLAAFTALRPLITNSPSCAVISFCFSRFVSAVNPILIVVAMLSFALAGSVNGVVLTFGLQLASKTTRIRNGANLSAVLISSLLRLSQPGALDARPTGQPLFDHS